MGPLPVPGWAPSFAKLKGLDDSRGACAISHACGIATGVSQLW